MTEIAILVPSFNSEQTIGQTLASLASQGEALQRISAVYVADDCSSDGTVQAAQEQWGGTVALHILQGHGNLGERRNVNQALKAISSHADWVLILHSDDIAKQDWLKTMVSRIEACLDSVGSICSSWDNLWPDGSITPGEDAPEKANELIQGTPESIRGTLLRGCWWHLSGCAIRLLAFQRVGGFDPNLPQMGDWEWLLRLLQHAWAVEYVPRSLILYRQHQKSVSFKSFQTDADVKERLLIMRRFSIFLRLQDLILSHFQNGYFILCRSGRALTKFRLGRCLRASFTLLSISINFLQCLVRNWRKAAHHR